MMFLSLFTPGSAELPWATLGENIYREISGTSNITRGIPRRFIPGLPKLFGPKIV
jgi:hypothetical protein